MMRLRFMHRLFLVLALAGLTTAAMAQAQAVQKPFEPTVGQPGKDVIWVPTANELVEKMLNIAKVGPEDFLIDLGSGDGRTVIAAAKRGIRALGIEYNPDMVELSIANAAREGVSGKASFIKGDVFESDFSKATVITLFLLPDLNVRLRPKILDLKPGTRVVSNTFSMGDWASDESSSVSDEGSSEQKVYSSFRTALLWIVPAKVAGTWQMEQGELVLDQKFQMIEGTLKIGDQSASISNGKLRGAEIHFEAGGAEYSGTVSGDRMQGSVKKGADSRPWSATLRPASE
jgi:hypothetical protein